MHPLQIKRSIFSTFLGCLYFPFVYGQSILRPVMPDIDPRQFLLIYEEGSGNRMDTIWQPTADTWVVKKRMNNPLYFRPEQKYRTIGENAILQIYFDRSAIIENPFTVGNISVAAWLNDRPIEVTPYSEIGKESEKIGIKTKPTLEISRNFIGLILQINALTFDINNLTFNYHKKVDVESNFKLIKEGSNMILEWLDFFSNSGYETTETFLTLIGSDKIRHKNNTENLKRLVIEMNKYTSCDELMKKDSGLLDRIVFYAKEIGRFEGSYFHQLVSELGYDALLYRSGTFDDYQNIIKQRDSSASENDAEFYKAQLYQFNINNYLPWNPRNIDTLLLRLSEKANSTIYKKLVLGTINLKKSDAKVGDVLRIEMQWFNANQNDTSSNSKPVNLAIASFDVVRQGWKIRPNDETSLLINRIYEDRLRDSYPKSPSRFKPTGGISLTWQYHNDRRYSNKYGNRNKPLMRIAKWLEPSFGLHVSYLDFDATKNFEIGIGPVIGLFEKKISITGGYNFNVENEQPFYIGIGFSFVPIINDFLNKDK